MSIIASAADELKFHQWSEGDLKQYYAPPNYTEGPIKTISWAKDGNWIVMVPCSGSVEVISIKESIKVLQRVQNVYHPTCAAFQNTTKRSIAVGTLSGQLLVYDIKLRNIQKRFPRATSPIFNVQYNARDSHFVAACANGDILLYNHLTTNLSSLYKVPKSESVSVVNFHRTKRNLLAGGSKEGVVATWDINTNQILCEMLAHQAAVTGVTFSPIRHDLIITGGLDRRFAFYDLAAKKRVIEVEVSSSTTALDFSSCGTFLGLGSQNGNIIVYDTRNFRKPISAFVGHEGKKIHHLIFQKVASSDSDSGDSAFDVSGAEEPDLKPPESENTSDSLGLITCDMSNAQEIPKVTQTEHDSFLAALGLNNSSLSEMSTHQDNSVGFKIAEDDRALLEETKRPRVDSPAENVVMIKTPFSNQKQISSTPKYLMENVPVSAMSPIVAPFPTNCSYNIDEIKQAIRDIVKEEFETQAGVLTETIRMEFWDTRSQIRRNILDLHMFVVRQFIEMETKINAINNATVREFVCDEFLIKRNEELMKEVESLREQLAEKNRNYRKF